MRHGKTFRRLNRTTSHRKAMLRNMVTSLIEHEQIKTTDAKAKELRGVAERMITLAKDGSLHARRQALAYVRSKAMVHKLFAELGPRFVGRDGGYVRIVKVGQRIGDGAAISVVSLVGEEVKKSRRRRKKADKPAPAKPAAETPKKVEAVAKTEEEAAPKKPKKPARKKAKAAKPKEPAPPEAETGE